MTVAERGMGRSLRSSSRLRAVTSHCDSRAGTGVA